MELVLLTIIIIMITCQSEAASRIWIHVVRRTRAMRGTSMIAHVKGDESFHMSKS